MRDIRLLIVGNIKYLYKRIFSADDDPCVIQAYLDKCSYERDKERYLRYKNDDIMKQF